MSCKIHFDPEPMGALGFVCGCGWRGAEPRYEMVPLMDEFVATCPQCRAEMQRDNVLVLDVGGGNRNVTKSYPDGKTWEKTLRTEVSELRLASDPRRMSSFTAKKWGSSIMWEIFRALEIKRPEKPRMADFETKELFFAAHKAYKAEWKKIFHSNFTIKQLLDGKAKKAGPVVAKEQTKAIVLALFGTLDGLKMSTGYKLISMASKLADERTKAAEAIRTRLMKRTTIKDMLNAIASKTSCDIDMAYLHSFLMQLFNRYGNMTIRTSAFKRMKVGSTWMPGLWMIKSTHAGVYEKSTWRYNDFKVMNASFFCNEEWSMNRGKPVMDKDGNGWIYNPETKDMDLVLSKDEDWHFTHGADWVRSDVHMGGKVPRHPGAE